MYTRNLRYRTLIEPLKNGVDELCIISGYATPGMASWHIQKLTELGLSPIQIKLIVGMCPADGIGIISHKGFQDIIKNFNPIPHYSQFSCQYIYQGPPVHTKLYVWLKHGNPVQSFTGSANYTQVAFSSQRREALTDCDPERAYQYFLDLDRDSIYCDHNEVEDYVRLTKKTAMYFEIEPPTTPSLSQVTLSLISKRMGDVGPRSGLNWGQRDNREPNQAYIPLPVHISRSGFFPLNKQHFAVLTDDDKTLILRVEQQNDKAITTPSNNSLLGEYFRNRLGVPNGAPVTKNDLLLIKLKVGLV